MSDLPTGNVHHLGTLGRIGIGFDPGQAVDSAAIAVVASVHGRYTILGAKDLGTGLELSQQADVVLRYHAFARSLRARCSHDPVVCVERNGMGLGVCEALDDRGLKFWWCTTVAGTERRRVSREQMSIGKIGLINDLVVALEQELINVAEDVGPDDRRKLDRQLRSYIAKQREFGIKMEAAPGEHDDVTMALGFALLASNNCQAIEPPLLSAPLIPKPTYTPRVF